MANKVQFGLSNVHYAVFDAANSTYETPVPVKGAVSMSLDIEGDSSKFYADNTAYFATNKNDGYTGTLEVAYVEQRMLTDLLGFHDDVGLLLEFSDSQPVPFALLFEIDGNVNKQRFVLYNCTLARPKTETKTTEGTVEPGTMSLEITAIGADLKFENGTRNVVKGVMEGTEQNKVKFDKFFDAVLMPTATADAA